MSMTPLAFTLIAYGLLTLVSVLYLVLLRTFLTQHEEDHTDGDNDYGGTP